MEQFDKSILVVDDEEPNRVLISHRLKREGYRVTAVSGGRAALEEMRARRFDLVLLDLMMPEMDGLATLDTIKSDPDLAQVPVLMLTASNAREAIVHCVSRGAADYMIKPVQRQLRG